MYILNGPRKEIVDSSFVERFCIVEHADTAMIIASYSESRKPVTISKYRDLKEARDVLVDMLGALAGGQTAYEMPESSLFYGENVKRDARTKRKGGS